MSKSQSDLLARLDTLTSQELKRYLVQELTRKKLGLVWEADLIDRDTALNANMVFPVLDRQASRLEGESASSGNLIIEGDNFDSLRLLKATHAGKIRVILIDPPYNTGNKDWVYNDDYVSKDDRWKHSTWLEFMYQRMVLARDLLTPDGVVLICINDENRSRLELMMDEVMPGRRVGSFVWRTRKGANDAKGGNLSIDHEHVLVYGNTGFEFFGSVRDETKYSNPDNDPRGAWGSQMLIKSHNARERPEAYYSIHNPATQTWYLCEPDSVWRFSSTTRPLNKALQADPIETIIKEHRVLWPANEKTVTYATSDELLSAIQGGLAPKELRIYLQLETLKKQAKKDGKVARLLSYIEPVEYWVGKKLGYGRPRYKRFRESLKRDTNPLSSWLNPSSESHPDEEGLDELESLSSGGTSEGTSMVRKLLGNKDFPYPKPMSLIKGLLGQATRSDDTVLDFFAGSGTTGHAVLALNAEDGGNRRFILCSNTEASKSSPDKNLCRDVCAERIRRVLDSDSQIDAVHSDFAYLTLAHIEEADLMFDATPEHSYNLLCLRETGHIAPIDGTSPLWPVNVSNDAAIVVCPVVNADSVTALEQLGARRITVYTERPDSLMNAVEGMGIDLTAYSVESALRWAQTARQLYTENDCAEADA